MLAFLQNRWFLLALIAVLVGGMVWWESFRPLTERVPRNAVVATVLLLMALPMETAAMWQAIRRPTAAGLGASINLGLAPVLGWLAGRLLPGSLAVGMIATTVAPCTLASATVWTRRAGGNDAVAILVTIVTNLVCFLVIPAWLRVLLGSAESGEQFDYGGLALQLALLVVAPLVVAQLARQWQPIARGVARQKTALGVAAQIGILSFVLTGAVSCGREIQSATGGAMLSSSAVVLMLAAVILVHLVLLAVGMAAARGLSLSPADAIAVGISGSQKTIMVGLFLALQLAHQHGAMVILPMIAYHAAQLVLDTLIADRFRARSAFAAAPPP